jgi:hypothetical protein
VLPPRQATQRSVQVLTSYSGHALAGASKLDQYNRKNVHLYTSHYRSSFSNDMNNQQDFTTLLAFSSFQWCSYECDNEYLGLLNEFANVN